MIEYTQNEISARIIKKAVEATLELIPHLVILSSALRKVTQAACPRYWTLTLMTIAEHIIE